MNLEAETRQGYYISSEMKKVWQVQLNLLQKLLDVCQKHGLKIWVDSGTLIGTVRDHGFIPWDDDIDTIMMRDDYEKLLQIAETEFEAPYHFSNRERFYPRLHAQLRMDGTAAILKYDVWHDIHQGVFIDIFVYDGVPEDYEERNRVREKVAKKYHTLRTLCSRENNFVGMIKKILCHTIFSVVSFDKYCDRIQSLYKRYKVSDYNRLYYWSLSVYYLEKLNIRKEWYDETIWMPFEDMMVPVPKRYHELLTCEYGDYMTPVNSGSLHGDMIFDAERSYVDVLKELRSKK